MNVPQYDVAALRRALAEDPRTAELGVHVRIRGDQLVPRNGSYDVRITSELEEVLYVDRLRLAVVDHPAGIEVFPGLSEKVRTA